MRTAVVALLLLGCDEPATPLASDTAALPVGEAPPPGAAGLDLEVDGAIERGGTMTFLVSGLAPGQRAWVVASPTQLAGGWCPPVLAGACVDLDDPVVIGTAVANRLGVARLDRAVPRTTSDRWWFQAFARRPFGATSDVVARYAKRHGEHFPVVFQTVYAANGQVLGRMLEAGAWADARNYIDRPWACYLRTRLVTAPLRTPVPCPGCEYAWRVELPEPFEELEVDGECASYFGYDAAFFDDLFAPVDVGGAEVDGGWAGFGGGAEWGVDVDYYDPSAGTIYPIVRSFSTISGTWWSLGPVGRVRHAGYDEFIVGVGYSGSFLY